jgi:molybdate transport system regulatory protein
MDKNAATISNQGEYMANHGAVNSGVEVKLSGGTLVTAMVTNGSVQCMQFAVGDQISAAFKASSVIIAVE